MGKPCLHPNCPRFAVYGVVPKIPHFCSDHRREGDVAVMGRRCQAQGCSTIAGFGAPEDGTPYRCSKHRCPGDINIARYRRATSRPCHTPGCKKTARYKTPNQCVFYCGEHRRPGDTRVPYTLCVEAGCDAAASHGCPRERVRLRCVAHRLGGDVRMASNQCRSPGCYKTATYGSSGGSRDYCAAHRRATDTDNAHPRCLALGCGAYASFGSPVARRRVACAAHRGAADVCLANRRAVRPAEELAAVAAFVEFERAQAVRAAFAELAAEPAREPESATGGAPPRVRAEWLPMDVDDDDVRLEPIPAPLGVCLIEPPQYALPPLVEPWVFAKYLR